MYKRQLIYPAWLTVNGPTTTYDIELTILPSFELINILTCLITLEHDPPTHAVSRFCDATTPDEIVFVSYLFNWMLREVYNF